MTNRYRSAAILAVILALAGCKKTNQYVAPPPPKVTVAKPVAQKITHYLEATGNVAAVASVDLVARVQGFLQEISYIDGAEVKKGDVLFTVEPLPYQAKLQQAQAAEAGTNAQLVDAEASFKRQTELQTRQVASVQALDDARAQRDSAQANVLQAQATTKLAAINYAYTRVLAPFDGRVSAHLVSVGELVGTSPTTLATIVQIKPIHVTFNISEQDVQRIRANIARRGGGLPELSKIPVEVGLQAETGFPHKGHLNYVAPTVDSSTGTLVVRGVLDNEDMALLPGYFARVRVPLQSDIDALLVPDIALNADQTGSYVLVTDKDNVVVVKHVTIGQLEGGMRVVETGLQQDDQVIISGLQRASPGQKVDPTVQAAAKP